jgi:hypothetical protein
MDIGFLESWMKRYKVRCNMPGSFAAGQGWHEYRSRMDLENLRESGPVPAE